MSGDNIGRGLRCVLLLWNKHASVREAVHLNDIFFSYAHEDRDKITPIVEALETKGWSVFWDPDIRSGETWRKTIHAEVESCQCMIVTWSNHSIDSEWVLDEAQAGKHKGILVPITLDGSTPPLGFRGIQTANLSAWDGDFNHPTFVRFIQDVESMLKTKPQLGNHPTEESTAGTIPTQVTVT